MNKCKEFDFSKVADIQAFPVGTLKLPPVYSIVPSLAYNTINPNNVQGTHIRFVKDSLKCSENMSTDVRTFIHTVSLEFGLRVSGSEDVNMLTTLLLRPHDVLVTYLGGTRKLIRTSSSGYQFSYNEDNGHTKCSFTLTNAQGLVPIQ